MKGRRGGEVGAEVVVGGGRPWEEEEEEGGGGEGGGEVGSWGEFGVGGGWARLGELG